MISVMLSNCKFCDGTATELSVRKVSAKEWVGEVHCGICEITVTPFYSSKSSELALQVVANRWNGNPEKRVPEMVPIAVGQLPATLVSVQMP